MRAGHSATRARPAFDLVRPKRLQFAPARANEYEVVDARPPNSPPQPPPWLPPMWVRTRYAPHWRPFIERADVEPQASGTPSGAAGFLREMPADEQPCGEELGKALSQETGSATPTLP